MIDIGLKFSGDLDAALDRFALDIQERVVIAGTAAAAKVMYDEAREQAATPSTGFTLKTSPAPRSRSTASAGTRPRRHTVT